MIAKISTGKSIIGLINYNEHKVAKGDARLLAAQNMVLGKKASELTYDMKVGIFKGILNGKKSKKLDKPTLHISLNFDPTEKLTDEVLKEIAGKYMKGMEYNNLPFLVYRHEDTHHPHIHIVSIKVDREGKKIKDSFYKRQSEKIRKALEIEYNLVKASEKIKQRMDLVQALPINALNTRKKETKKTITHVVNSLLATYKVSSLQEFQTLLKQYNVNLEHIKGTINEKPYEGLVYSLIDGKGNRAGVGIKASSIYSKPTLQNLELQFAKNNIAKNKLRRKTATKIEELFRQYSSITKEDFTRLLAERGIITIYHSGKEGIDGITFIDHDRKTLFIGRDLGKPYTWDALEKFFAPSTLPIDQINKLDKNESIHRSTSNHVYSKKELFKEATRTLVHIYNQQRTFKINEEPLESLFIRKLHQIDLSHPLVKKLPLLNLTQAKVLEEKFKAYKQSKLPNIEAKEKACFEKQAEKAFSIIHKTSHLSPQDNLIFLFRCEIDIAKENTGFVAKHTKAEHLKTSLGEDKLQKLLIDKGTLPTLDKEKIAPFTKGQGSLIDKIVKTMSSSKEIPNQHKVFHETAQEIVGNKEKAGGSKISLADVFQGKNIEPDNETSSGKNKKRRKMRIS